MTDPVLRYLNSECFEDNGISLIDHEKVNHCMLEYYIQETVMSKKVIYRLQNDTCVNNILLNAYLYYRFAPEFHGQDGVLLLQQSYRALTNTNFFISAESWVSQFTISFVPMYLWKQMSSQLLCILEMNTTNPSNQSCRNLHGSNHSLQCTVALYNHANHDTDLIKIWNQQHKNIMYPVYVTNIQY